MGRALVMGLSPPPVSAGIPLVHVSPAGWDKEVVRLGQV